MQENKRARFIAVTGLDGSGKTTVIDEVISRLNKKGILAKKFQNHEPFSNYWDTFKQVFAETKPSYELDRFMQAFELCMAARDGLPQLLEESDFVFSDRYVLDKIIYGRLRGQQELAEMALRSIPIQPDVNVYLRLSPQIAHQRIMQSSSMTDWKETPFWLQQAYNQFEQLSNDDLIVPINAQRSIREVSDELLSVIRV